MLIKILKRLTEGGVYSNSSMARELGIDEGLVEQMIIQLQHKGYIEKDSMDCCSESCGCGNKGCTKKSSCCGSNSNVSVNIWKITDKGKSMLKRVG